MNERAWRAALGFGALCLVAPATGAVSLGRLEVRSHSGAPLDARIPVLAGKDEPLRGACFSLAPRGPVPLRAPSLELRNSARGASLFVRTRGAVADGAAFAIAIGCPGAPSASAVPVEYAVRFGASAERKLPVVTSFDARSGDSLASLARAIFPDDDSIRARYLQAIRAENDALSGFGDEEALPEGTGVALPDLHAFARTIAPARAPDRPKVAALRRAPPTAAARKSEPVRRTPATHAAAAPGAPRSLEVASSSRPRAPARDASAAGFRLRLSAPVLDLTPSQGMDASSRARLRERLLALEADDRTAAMLALRENLRRLEAQVSELKLKLAAMPTSLPAPAAASRAPKAPPAKVELPKIETPKAQAPPKIAAPPKAEAPKVEADRSPSAAPGGPSGPDVMPRPPGDQSGTSSALWWLRLLLVPLAGFLGLRYFARRRSEEKTGAFVEEVPPDLATTQPGLHEVAPEEPSAPAAPTHEPVHGTAVRVPAEDNIELRRRYMEERFPEVVNGAVMLDDPRSAVQAARLLYEDGAVPRAVELLQFAIEQDPDAMPAWLALFEIFRLQRLSGEFAELSRRFSERHGDAEEWRKVRTIGRSLDPANPLYEGVEAGMPMEPGAEEWLRTPGDDARQALAGELRSRLMAAACVCDADLRADPTPALRKAEVFSVA